MVWIIIVDFDIFVDLIMLIDGKFVLIWVENIVLLYCCNVLIEWKLLVVNEVVGVLDIMVLIGMCC